MEVLTGLSDPHEAARKLHEWGSERSISHFRKYGVSFTTVRFYRIPAYKPDK